MSESAEGKKGGCLRRAGCGCAVLLGAGLLAVVIMLAVSWFMRPGPPEPRSDSFAHALVPDPEREPGGAVIPAEASLPPAGRLVLDISEGEFDVVPGAEGAPLTVEAQYDASVHFLSEGLVETADGSWSYEVSFGTKAGPLALLFAGARSEPRVKIVVPRGLPLDIVGEISKGQAELELGGLALRAVDLEVGMGQVEIAVSEPTPAPVESIHVEGAMGQLVVRGLGNASPTATLVEFAMGDVDLDLDGEWRAGAEVDIEFRMGSCRIHAPPDVQLEIVEAKVSAGDVRLPSSQAPADAAAGPIVRLTATGSAGELRISR